MAEITQADVEHILKGYTLPFLDEDPISANIVKSIEIKNGLIKIELELGIPTKGIEHQITEELSKILKLQTTATDVLVNLNEKIIAHAVQKNVTALPGVKNVIAVGSGKGGVGKSTVSVNLAMALKEEGARVGIMDADIYGPSIPTMLNCHDKPESPDGKHFVPLEAHGLQCVSMGQMLDSDDAPVIWRGPMATSALQQLLREAEWHDLDYLIIDLPPGTGDIQLTLCQNIPVTGAVIVTTPQDIAMIDAKKALKMFDKVAVSVIGIVENMSTHVCSNCGHEESIFGSGAGEKMSDQYGVPLLGQLPLTMGLRECMDQGKPETLAEKAPEVSESFQDIARQVAIAIAKKPKDFASMMPKVVVETHKS